MLPLKNRLTKKKDLEMVFQEGRGVSVGPVFLKFRKNGLLDSRFGVSVGIKFSKKAVERNRVKRQIRAALREELGRIRKGFDVVVVPRIGRDLKTKEDVWKRWLLEAMNKGEITIKK